jgi:hypothetical protein
MNNIEDTIENDFFKNTFTYLYNKVRNDINLKVYNIADNTLWTNEFFRPNHQIIINLEIYPKNTQKFFF